MLVTHLVHSLAQHSPNELKQLQMVVLKEGRRRRVETLLRRHSEQV